MNEGGNSLGYVWGVDSAQTATEELYDCVLKSFGKPNYWGRYLTTVPDASEGLTKEEILFLHNSGTRVLPIYNNFKEARGFRKGKVTAQNAAFHAKRLKFPKETILFANVERFFDVDEAWIRGYVEGMIPTGYKSGFYNDPVEGDFNSEYCKAVSKNKKVAVQSILWSAEPEVGVTKARNAPRFRPKKPACKANVWGWQYARDAKACPVNTNLVDDRVYNNLW